MEIEKKETTYPCCFCGKELVIYPDSGGHRAKCRSCGVHTIVCQSPLLAVDAYYSIRKKINETQEPLLERSENARAARRAVVIDEICKRLGAVAFIKGPLNELHEIATKVKELK